MARSLCDRLFFVSADLTTARRLRGVGDAAQRDRERPRARENATACSIWRVPPSVFEPIVRNLSKSGLAPRTRTPDERPWMRVVIEKPFGRSLESAQQLNDLVLGLFAEHQTYRIDHYLGKETVQNVLVLRFANSIFEPLWNRQWIHHVQITAAETVGVEERGKYYEEAGVVRDMFQNHLLQLLSLTAMEPPAQMTANAVRDEKVKVLRSIRWLTPESIPRQHGARAVHRRVGGGKPATGLRRGAGRLAGIHGADVRRGAPLRRQLAMERRAVLSALRQSASKNRVSEIAVQFRAPPHLMFGHQTREAMRPNTLVMRVQPNEGVSLNFEVKVPGAAVRAHVEHRDRAGGHGVQLRRGVWRESRRRRTKRCCST